MTQLEAAPTDSASTPMTQEDSIFGAEPDDLKRLVSFGLEADDPQGKADAPATASVDGLMERPGVGIGRYKLLRVLGKGGMGVVYLAQQDEPVRREVALKVIKPGMDSARVMARFETEQQALALMEHPHVARVYDAGLTGSGRPYFVMEHVKGIPITEHCDKYTLTVEQRLELFLHVCEAVQHAHQKGIIHRDLKPSNVLVTIEDDKATPKVIDFGVARAVSQPLTRRTLYTEEGQLIGTPEYMSPEQADLNNQDIDTRTDIYTLGVVLYELLAGVPPFEPRTFQAGGVEHIRKVICEEEPKTPSIRLSRTSVDESTESARRRRTNARALQRRLQGDLDWITLKAMEKDRNRRYASAGELAADIRRHLSHEPVLASPPGTVYRLSKFVRRHKGVVAGTLAVLAVSLLGTVVSTVFAIGQARARDDAQAVSDFLNGSVIELFDPYKVASEEITRRSLLDAVSENLEQDFTGPPLAEAKIRHTLGFAYWSIGVYELAASHYERALEVCRARLGAEHATTLEWMENLGWVYVFQGRFREAEPLFRQALEGARRVRGEEHEQTGHSMWSLGSLYWWQGRNDEAEPFAEKALEISRRRRGEEDRHTVETMWLVAWVYLMQGRYHEAEQVSDEALAINLRLRGQKDYWTLNLKTLFGAVCWKLGRYKEASRHVREALDGRRRLYGEEHLDTLYVMVYLGIVYASQGRCEEAKSLFDEALETARRVLGNTHPVAALSMHGLGTLYLSRGRYDDAERLLVEALEVERRVQGEAHPTTLWTMNTLARLHTAQGRYNDAAELFGGALAARRRTLGDEHPDTLESINDLGVLRREQQRYDEAESLLRQALDGRQHKLGLDHPAYFESKHELAVLHIRQARYEDAEPLLLEAFHGRETKLGPEHPHTLDSLRELVGLYESWGKPDEVANWRTKRDSGKPQTTPVTSDRE